MANLPILITIQTPAPVSSKDLPKLTQITDMLKAHLGGKVVQGPPEVARGQLTIHLTATVR